MRIDFYADTVCPWCYVAMRRLRSALPMRPQYAPQVRWRPFELNPELPIAGMERAQYLAARVADFERVKEGETALAAIGKSVGIEFRFDLIARVPNSRRSHLLIAHAARRGRQNELEERLLRAYFEEGRDIGDIDELVHLGVDCGLADAEIRSALVLRTGQDAIVAAERHAVSLGLTGVPAFVFNGVYAICGVQEVDVLVNAMDRVAAEAALRHPQDL